MKRRLFIAAATRTGLSGGVAACGLVVCGQGRAATSVADSNTPQRKRAVRPASIPPGYIVMGRLNGVPPLILYGVALQESAQLFGDRTLPYPWTLNVHGAPRRYETYERAVTGLRLSAERGETLVDCGLMQVCWRYHWAKLGSFWAALDPYNNIGVGARILRGHFETTRDWYTAVGRYHNEARKDLASAYAHAVYQRIRRIPGVDAQGHGAAHA